MNLATSNRFADRVDTYSKYRPSYPKAVLEFLVSSIGLDSKSIVADIGSGTGISSRLFVDNGNTVFAIEPNTEMREQAEFNFRENPNFISVDGSAEKVGCRTIQSTWF